MYVKQHLLNEPENYLRCQQKKNCFPVENWLTKRQTTDQIDERKLFNKSNEKIEKSEKNPAEMHTHTITS